MIHGTCTMRDASHELQVSLAQQGVALMEIQEYSLALASFLEALRIRRKALGSKHPLVVRLLNNIGCAFFETNDLEASKVAFEDALNMQRKLMRENKGTGLEDDSRKNYSGLEVHPKNAHQMLLSIALTLCNLGSIHLRCRQFDKSIVFFEEALLVSFHIAQFTNAIFATLFIGCFIIPSCLRTL